MYANMNDYVLSDQQAASSKHGHIYSIYGVALQVVCYHQRTECNTVTHSRVIAFAVTDHQLSFLYTQLLQVLTKALSHPLMLEIASEASGK